MLSFKKYISDIVLMAGHYDDKVLVSILEKCIRRRTKTLKKKCQSEVLFRVNLRARVC